LETAADALDGAGWHRSAERFAYLAAEAVLRGYYDPPGADNASRVTGLLSGIEHDPYYRLLAAVRLGKTEGLVRGTTSSTVSADGNEAPPRSGSDSNPEERSKPEQLVRGYLDFGLYEASYEAARELEADLPVHALETVAERIQSRGFLIESLRLMARARGKADFVLTERSAKLLYPRAFSIAMERVAEQEGLDLAVFYGLVREESHFDAEIRSHAGATGLAQLMPATADDMARRMRLSDPDLTDPDTNLSIGGYYLSYLLERFDGELLPALAAYNGGQGRVRRWVRENGALSGPLFHEAMPIRETRHYIRKVLVSAAYYGEIYDGRSIAETVRLFYPDLTPIDRERET
jgi:soluble lytic murein transglycosylase